ncbi:MAG: TetR/AcrR family transcriptional regulator [Ruminococcus sp.]|nr:TetR/AcrR family transcriptional regulator [Ruminococcus sp.]
MPPKPKITREMIIDAGLETVRKEGGESLNVRRIAASLGCSTQPVMYSYSSMEKLREDIFKKAGEFHTNYLMEDSRESENPMLGIGLRYIRFAKEERNLFRFLFRSGNYNNGSFEKTVSENVPPPVLESLQKQTGLTGEDSMEVFTVLFVSVHGFASFAANNAFDYSEEYCAKLLTELFMGIVGYKKSKQILN